MRKISSFQIAEGLELEGARRVGLRQRQTGGIMIFAAKSAWGKRSFVVLTIALASLPAAAVAQSEPSKGESALKSVEGEGTPAVVLDDNRVESLLGKEVSGARNETIGRIVDVLVSRQGELRAAVIDFGGFLGVGSRKVAVSWSTLSFGDKGPVLQMTADELRVTPEYRVGEPVVVVGAPKAADGAPPSAVDTVKEPPASTPSATTDK